MILTNQIYKDKSKGSGCGLVLWIAQIIQKSINCLLRLIKSERKSEMISNSSFEGVARWFVFVLFCFFCLVSVCIFEAEFCYIAEAGFELPMLSGRLQTCTTMPSFNTR
jgi:hypothetical protein